MAIAKPHYWKISCYMLLLSRDCREKKIRQGSQHNMNSLRNENSFEGPLDQFPIYIHIRTYLCVCVFVVVYGTGTSPAGKTSGPPKRPAIPQALGPSNHLQKLRAMLWHILIYLSDLCTNYEDLSRSINHQFATP